MTDELRIRFEAKAWRSNPGASPGLLLANPRESCPRTATFRAEARQILFARQRNPERSGPFPDHDCFFEGLTAYSWAGRIPVCGLAHRCVEVRQDRPESGRCPINPHEQLFHQPLPSRVNI